MNATDAIARARAHAPYLRRALDRRPDLADLLAADRLDEARTIAGRLPEGPIGAALRQQRQAVSLVLGIGDLAGTLALEAVIHGLSDLADAALDHAIAAAFAERYPDAPVQGFAVIALGKHGSRELNYSSDIDPILIFDPATMPHRAREEPIEAAVRIGQRVVELLQAKDEHGHVFRVDLRLRPSPEATPIALPVEAAISYYESSALPWERAAFIRARAAAGDRALGVNFLAAIRPFVWRRALDYGTVREIRGISRRIRDHHAQGQALGPGYDLKRGRGGIREVEFFAQIHQLIHGGREPALRAPATLEALAALAAAGRIEGDVVAALSEAYRLYRTIEHRLQMVEDRQTHALPKQADELDNVARLHGLADGAALIALLAPHVDRIGRLYDSLDDERPERLSQDTALLEGALAQAGFPDTAAARQRIESWRSGKLRALRTPAALDALEAMLPGLVGALGKAHDPNVAMNRFDDIVAKLPTAINLFRLLEARPALARMVGDVLVHAPALADALGRRPSLLDGLIDATAFDPPPDVPVLIAQFGAGDADEDYERLLDRVRQMVGERRFALGVQLVEGAGDPIDISAGYARVAEAALAALAQATVAEYEAAHGRVPGGELLILALGRLGGAALTHASDLDLVYLFTGDHMVESDGRKPLPATQYFNRLAQRISAAMSVPTAAGPLYEVDTRLRPSGTQGLLAVSTESFALYQRESAWTWEHMALTRARPVFGSDQARRALQAIIDETLGRPRDPASVRADAVKMRAEMARHKPPAGPFDVKLIDGGLVDCEFTVHLTQLATGSGVDPHMGRAVRALAERGLLAPAMVEAHDLLQRLLVTLRLVSPQSGAPLAVSRPLVAKACGMPDWEALVAAYDAARATVASEWRRVAGP